MDTIEQMTKEQVVLRDIEAVVRIWSEMRGDQEVGARWHVLSFIKAILERYK